MLIGELMAPFFYAPTVGFIWLGVTIGVTVRGYYFFKLGIIKQSTLISVVS